MKYFFICVLSFLCFNSYTQLAPEFLTNYDKRWVDSTFQTLSLDEKIGQLLMPRGNVSGKPHDIEKLARWVQQYKIGGIVFFAGPPTVQAKLTNYLQSLSKVPLFIGEDFEWGLAMRMDSTDRFPYQMALGAIQNKDTLLEEMGAEIGQQCKRLGVHINYAPVVDINNNIANPVINFRSFGSNKNLVAQKGLAYMKGLQSQNIISTAKHFPGHGDTDVDSHKDIPVIAHDKNHLTDNELFPFQQLINHGLTGIMTAHLDVAAFEPKSMAATFSSNIVSDLLRKKMNFKGLTFTDAMDMKGAVKNFPNGEALVKALVAGNDILETFEDVPLAIDAIKKAIKNSDLSESLINEKVKRILMAKSWVGLNKYKPIQIQNLIQDLNSKKSDFLNRVFSEESITLLKNENNLIPIPELNKKFAIVSIDANEITPFQLMCSNYTDVDVFQLPINANDSLRNIIFEKLKSYDYTIVGLHLKEVRASSKYSINESNMKTCELFSSLNNATLCVFGNVLCIPQIESLKKYNAIFACYQNTKYTQESTAQMLFGGLPAKGKLPISLNSTFIQGYGLNTTASRISYGIPEQVNVNGDKLNYLIDSILNLGLTQKAFPGAVVQIVKDGKSILRKGFGYHTYEDAKNNKSFNTNINDWTGTNNQTDAMDYFGKSLPPTQNKSNEIINGKVYVDDIYDLASLTKVSASALAMMQLMSVNKFDINKNFGFYVPELKGTNKENLIFRDMLTHKSGLQAWIPFWKNAIDTIATINKAIKINPELQNLFKVKTTKPSFWKKLFGKKNKSEILYFESLSENQLLWEKCLNSKTKIWKPNTFLNSSKGNSNIKISDKLFITNSFQSTVFKEIANSSVNTKQGYLYSDLHYYFYPKIVQSLTNLSFEKYLDSTYKSLGASTLTFNPLDKFKLERIAPTEFDSTFRNEQIHGNVHDEGAIMLGGISGHAGLFGNCNDLSKLLLMYLNKGRYGNKSYINFDIIDQCTSYQFPSEKNRRGLFFDKLDFDKKTNGPSLASNKSYGHSGFTGTFLWVDPQENLFYVFLSNRVYPTRENKKISELNIRTEVGNAIYKSIIK